MKKTKKRKFHLLIECSLAFLICFGGFIALNYSMYWKGILYQAVTNEAEAAYLEAESTTEYFLKYVPCEWLFPYCLDHPEVMESREIPDYERQIDILSDFGKELGWNYDEILPGTRVTELSEEDKITYASLMYDLVLSLIREQIYSNDVRTTLDGPMLSCVKDGRVYMLASIEEDYPFKPGDPIEMHTMEIVEKLPEREKGPGFKGESYKWIERSNPYGKNYGAVIYPFEGRDGVYGYSIVGINPEALSSMNTRQARRVMRYDIVASAGIFLILILIIYIVVIRPVTKVDQGVKRYTENKNAGEIAELMGQVHIRNEIGRLADSISEMAGEIDEHIRENQRITEEQAKAQAELDFARLIQTSAVPSVFPPFPEQKAFGLFAGMDTAKQVGGDFYDFFILPGDLLALVIADVSDKGVPAAMFMMRAKTLIKTYVEQGLPIDEVAVRTNRSLCTDNDMEMFVTVWMGFLNLKTGVMQYIHAGHTFPVLFGKRGAKDVKQLKELMFGYMPDAKYHTQVLRMKKGDSLFLYTDGVNEAMDPDGEQYGEERLLKLLSSYAEPPEGMDDNVFCEAVCRKVSEDIESFAEGTQQADDITMLCVRWSKDKA